MIYLLIGCPIDMSDNAHITGCFTVHAMVKRGIYAREFSLVGRATVNDCGVIVIETFRTDFDATKIYLHQYDPTQLMMPPHDIS